MNLPKPNGYFKTQYPFNEIDNLDDTVYRPNLHKDTLLFTIRNIYEDIERIEKTAAPSDSRDGVTLALTYTAMKLYAHFREIELDALEANVLALRRELRAKSKS